MSLLVDNSKWLFLVRHEESIKNTEKRFASSNINDALTAFGRDCCRVLGSELSSFIRERLWADRVRLVSGSSVRAQATAKIIGTRLGVVPVLDNNLNSIVVDQSAGLSVEQLLQTNPKAVRDLLLYRAGLHDSYQMTGVQDSITEFEPRVLRSLLAEVQQLREVTVIVANRSVLTVMLLHFARSAGFVSREHFGYVSIDLGSVSLVRITSVADFSGEILFANLHRSDLHSVGALLLE